MKRLIVALAALAAACTQNPMSGTDVPAFRVDPNWPRPLPEDQGVQLLVGQVSGIAVDERNGHVWIVHRPATLLPDEWNAKEARPVTHRCCRSLPAVVEFDAAGNFVRAWGGPGAGYAWPKSEHGVYVDPDGNIWLAGNAEGDNQILKFSPEGQFLMQDRARRAIGRQQQHNAARTTRGYGARFKSE